ncbi:MAG: hypothetical protein CM1200mP18_19720 [Gammaproteobacteria bacterium]|nr:MAG: hypothetical protein CM1200mP18_19720 [Gammaproteobacteria bacterium]
MGPVQRGSRTVSRTNWAMLLTTARAKEMFLGHPYQIGIIGSLPIPGAGVLLNRQIASRFGASLNFWTTSFGTAIPTVPLIQVDSERGHIGQWYSADVALVVTRRQSATVVGVLPTRLPEEKPLFIPPNSAANCKLRPFG